MKTRFATMLFSDATKHTQRPQIKPELRFMILNTASWIYEWYS